MHWLATSRSAWMCSQNPTDTTMALSRALALIALCNSGWYAGVTTLPMLFMTVPLAVVRAHGISLGKNDRLGMACANSN